MLKSLPSKSLYSAWDEAGWEGEPGIGRARRPAVFPESSTMVKLPVRGTRIPNPLKVKVNWVQALSPLKGSRLFIWGRLPSQD